MSQDQQPGKSTAHSVLLFLAGVCFAFLWASASTATKLGLEVAQPFLINVTRFFIAGVVMLFISHGLMRNRRPLNREWKQLAIYGLLNISGYLGLYVIAMKNVSPGLGSLAIATNPVMINLLGALLFGQAIKANTWISLGLCMLGVLIAAYPLLQNSYATPRGLLLLLTSMLIYSCGILYFSRQNWNQLHILTINGWQTFLGGIFLWPVAAITYRSGANHWNWQFAGAVGWLAIPVSIIAVQLWLYLLRDNAVKASFWLFLCPVFGYLIANVVMKEPIGIFTVAGMALVLTGLYLVQRKKAKIY